MELVDLEDELNSNEVSLTDIVNSKPSVIGEVYYTKWMTVYKHYPDGQMFHDRSWQVGGPVIKRKTPKKPKKQLAKVKIEEEERH